MSEEERLKEQGKRLRVLRNEKGLNQKEFAEKINISQPHLSLVEKGERPLLRKVLLKICNEFSVNEKWLENGEFPIYIDKNEKWIESNEISLNKRDTSISENIEDILTMYDGVDENGQEIIRIMLQDLYDKVKYLKNLIDDKQK